MIARQDPVLAPFEGEVNCWLTGNSSRPVLRRQCQGIAAKFHYLQLLRLQASNERTLQRARHEWILLRPEIPL